MARGRRSRKRACAVHNVQQRSRREPDRITLAWDVTGDTGRLAGFSVPSPSTPFRSKKAVCVMEVSVRRDAACPAAPRGCGWEKSARLPEASRGCVLGPLEPDTPYRILVRPLLHSPESTPNL